MNHRKTPPGRALVLPMWAIVVSAMFCLGVASWLAVDTVVGRTVDAPATTQEPSPEPTTATMKPEPTEEPEPEEPEPEPEEPEEDPVERDVAVGVFNNSGIAGLARQTAGRVEAAGWPVGTVGNWRGNLPESTIYYPAGFEDQAVLLAGDVGIDRVIPAVASMRMDRLTLVLTGS